MSSFPPRHLCIAGALFIAFGAGSVPSSIAKLIEGRFFIDIGFVLIPIGYGILIGRDSSRKWALFLSILGFVGSAIAVGCTLHEPWAEGNRLPYPDRVSTLFKSLLSGGCFLYVIITLTRRGHSEWFAAEKEDRSAAKSLAWAVAVVAGFLFTLQHVTEWMNREIYETAMPFRTRVTPYNALNGKGLTSYSYDSDAVSRSKDSKSKLPKVNVSYIGGDDGPYIEFYGMAAQPFEVTLHSDGFQDKTLTLSGNSEIEIRVPMQPLDAADPKQEAGGKPAAR